MYRKFDQPVGPGQQRSQSNTFDTDPAVVWFFARFGSFLSLALSLNEGDSSSRSSNITANQIHVETFEWYCFLLSRWDNRTFDTENENGREEGSALKPFMQFHYKQQTNVTITSTAPFFGLVMLRSQLRNFRTERNEPHQVNRMKYNAQCTIHAPSIHT